MSKIIFINCTDIGSTGEVIWLTAKYISKHGWKSILCSPSIHRQTNHFLEIYKTSFRYEQGIYRRVSYIFNNIYGFAPISTRKILKKIKQESPDIVHIHCANGNMVNVYSVLQFLKKENIKTIITNHAEFYYTGYCSNAKMCNRWLFGCGKCPEVKRLSVDTTGKRWKQMKRALEGMKNVCVTSVSPWVLKRSAASPIMNNTKQVLIKNCVDTEIFSLCEETAVDFDKIKVFDNCKIILHVTASFSNTRHDKAGAYLIDLARRFENDGVKFMVAGPYYNLPPLPKNITLLGKIEGKEKLAQLYNYADLCVVTSERETFGMTVAESLCCGTPVVGFKAGGSESIAIEEYSEFCEFGETDMLERIIRTKWLSYKNDQNKVEISNKAKEVFNEETMALQYLNLYENMRREYE